MAASAYPDLLLRKKSDNQVYVVPTNGMTRFGAADLARRRLVGLRLGAAQPRRDRRRQGRPAGAGRGRRLHPDPPRRRPRRLRRTLESFDSLAGHDLVTVAGDLDGDGHADLVARDPATGRLDAYLGNGQSGFTVKQLGDSWGKYDVIDGPGDVDGDGRADLVARGTEGAFYLLPGIGGVGFGDPVRHRRHVDGLRHDHRSRRLQR